MSPHPDGPAPIFQLCSKTSQAFFPVRLVPASCEADYPKGLIHLPQAVDNSVLIRVVLDDPLDDVAGDRFVDAKDLPRRLRSRRPVANLDVSGNSPAVGCSGENENCRALALFVTQVHSRI